MKNLKLYLPVFLLTSFLLMSCDNELTFYQDNTPPSPPENVRVFNGDNQVDIIWDYNPESDVAGYNVYYNYSYQGKYTLIGSTEGNYFNDYEAVNGETYYYAVAAYDYNGNESELSYDVVYATPRPEGYNQALFDYNINPDGSGYSFADYSVVPFNSDYADFFFENYDGALYLDVWRDTDIQDMGATNDIYDIPEAPLDGWVLINPGENIKYVEAIPGHTYIVWTWDNHFAKIRISAISGERMVFDWVYQTVEGNSMLKMKNVPEKREVNFENPVRNK